MALPEHPRVLIVGLGAVGHVVGAAFSRAGCDVVFYARRAGVSTVAVDVRGRGCGFACAREFAVVGAGDDVSGFDVVVLAVPAPLPPADDALWAVVDKNAGAVVVSMAPGAGAAVSGNVGFLAFAAPLPSEATPTPRARERHTAVFFPPLSPCTFAGPGAADVVAVLRRAGLPAVVDDDAARAGARLNAIVVPVVLALRLAGASFWQLARRQRGACARAIDAASRVVAAQQQAPRSTAARLLSSPVVVGVVFAGAAALDALRLLPLSLQTYARVHFEKTHTQTMQLVARFVADGAAAGVDVAALRALAGRRR